MSNAEMTEIADLAALVQVQPQSTVSRTVLKAEGTNVVLFAFDTDEELREHTAAIPVLPVSYTHLTLPTNREV